MPSYKQNNKKKKKKARRKVILMNQITISLLRLSCTRSITLIKKQITLQNWCFTGTVHSFIFKPHSSLAHIITLSCLMHIFIALPQRHYNKTLRCCWETCRGREEKTIIFFSLSFYQKILRVEKMLSFKLLFLFVHHKSSVKFLDKMASY